MTTLEKLGILGIRSFSSEATEVLQFERPLTLIVGHNGAGKTTIVECLKMATTGELPPNAGKGQFFVHNPRANDAPEVKGQIRLVFRTPQEKSVLVLRNFQLSNTKDRKGRSKASFKALESVIQIKDADGTTRSLNKKCVEMDAQVPSMMRVSKAILENVVFCHQEESNWPLGEMAKLKKKFDDLFGATRYSKALEAINTVRKDHQKLAKEKLHELELLASHLEQAQNLQNKIDQGIQRNEIYTNEIRATGEILREKQEECNRIRATLESVKQIEIDVAFRKHLIESLSREIEGLRINLSDLYDATPKELHETYTNMKNEILTKENSTRETDEKISILEQQLSENSRRKETTQNQRLESTRSEVRLTEALKRRSEISERIQKEFGASLGVDEQGTRLLIALRNAKQEELNEQENNGNLNLLEIAKRQTAKQNELTQCEAQKANAESIIERLKTEISDCRSRLAEESSIRDELLSIATKVSAVEESQRAGSVDQKLADLEIEAGDLRRRRQHFGSEFEKATTQIQSLECVASIQHQLESECQSLAQRKDRLEIKANTIRDQYHLLLGAPLDLKKLMSTELTVEITNTQTMLNRSQKDRADREKDVGQALGKLQLITTEVTDLEREHQELGNTLRTAHLKFENFEKSLQRQRLEVESKKRELSVTECAETFYSNFLKHSENKRKCAFCNRPFDTDEELEACKKYLNSRLEKIPETRQEFAAAVGTASSRLQEIEKMQSIVTNIERINNLLPQRGKEKTSLEGEVRNFKLALENAEQDVSSSNEKLTKLTELRFTLEGLKADIEECKRFETRVESLKARVAAECDEGGKARINDTRQQIRDINQQLKDVDQIIVLKETELSSLRTRKTSQMIELNELNLKKQSLEDRVLRFEEVRNQLDSKSASLNSLSNSLPSLKLAAETAYEQSQAVRAEYQKAQSTHATMIQNLRHSVDDLGTVSNELCLVAQKITEARQAQIDAADVFEKLKRLDERETQIIKQVQEQRRISAELRRGIAQQKTDLESIEQNIQYGEKQQDLERVQKELNHLYSQVGGGADPQILRKELEKSSGEVNKASNEIALKKGEQKSNQEFLIQHRNELKASKFKDVDKYHQNAMIECETELMVTRDLQKYHNALDKALMKYHTVKMQQINRTIRQLWQKTYKGRDIDFIAIRSDTEEELQFATTGQRSYNYRVTMVKDCIELEMRGRCSAGQKVLASIVIRLALAESFCVDCGILTLDEPTTNLDQENMEGLARAIADLIEDRRSCANFQLILITHDEEFVRMLARHQPCDSYFEVEKDQNGYSTIRRRDIHHF